MNSLAELIQWWPVLSGLVINGVVLGLALYARRATRMRGFTLLAISSAIHVAMTAPSAYTQHLLRSEGVSAYARVAMWNAGSQFVASLVCSFLFIGAILWLIEDVRRLIEQRGPTATATANEPL